MADHLLVDAVKDLVVETGKLTQPLRADQTRPERSRTEADSPTAPPASPPPTEIARHEADAGREALPRDVRFVIHADPQGFQPLVSGSVAACAVAATRGRSTIAPAPTWTLPWISVPRPWPRWRTANLARVVAARSWVLLPVSHVTFVVQVPRACRLTRQRSVREGLPSGTRYERARRPAVENTTVHDVAAAGGTTSIAAKWPGFSAPWIGRITGLSARALPTEAANSRPILSNPARSAGIAGESQPRALRTRGVAVYRTPRYSQVRTAAPATIDALKPGVSNRSAPAVVWLRVPG